MCSDPNCGCGCDCRIYYDADGNPHNADTVSENAIFGFSREMLEDIASYSNDLLVRDQLDRIARQPTNISRRIAAEAATGLGGVNGYINMIRDLMARQGPDGGQGADHCGCDDNPQPIAAVPPPRPGDFPTTTPFGSPLILDLNGDGVRTTNVENGVYFDHDGNRFAGKSGWVNAEDALLVRNIDGNGQIDSGNELFGNNTELSNGNKAANGFAALAEFDSNGDGIVDKNDERWGELKLWQDRNGDGRVDDGGQCRPAPVLGRPRNGSPRLRSIRSSA